MEELVQKITDSVNSRARKMFEIACDIFDHPEIGRQEYYASDLLTKTLEGYGFTVERGLAELPTSFKAVYENGKGGPTIGFLGEYDCLRNLGHGCGHHMQTPACLGAALAVRDVMGDKPYKLIIYGTPDEEIDCGKGQMCDHKVFNDSDVCINWHASAQSRCSYKNKANIKTRVEWHGKPAHASGAPWNGRSALDAAVLTFHALEIMREHIEDGCRIHYSMVEGTGATNIVHPRALVDYSLRALDNEYLMDMQSRFMDILKGAALMTGTTYDAKVYQPYLVLLPVPTLRETMLDCLEAINPPRFTREIFKGGGSTDVGNVSWEVPTVFFQTAFYPSSAHTQDWVDAGKTEIAFDSMTNGSKAAALFCCRLINEPEILEKAKAEWKADKEAATGKKA